MSLGIGLLAAYFVGLLLLMMRITSSGAEMAAYMVIWTVAAIGAGMAILTL